MRSGKPVMGRASYKFQSVGTPGQGSITKWECSQPTSNERRRHVLNFCDVRLCPIGSFRRMVDTSPMKGKLWRTLIRPC